jgi:hypothetical protein
MDTFLVILSNLGNSPCPILALIRYLYTITQAIRHTDFCLADLPHSVQHAFVRIVFIAFTASFSLCFSLVYVSDRLARLLYSANSYKVIFSPPIVDIKFIELILLLSEVIDILLEATD